MRHLVSWHRSGHTHMRSTGGYTLTNYMDHHCVVCNAEMDDSDFNKQNYYCCTNCENYGAKTAIYKSIVKEIIEACENRMQCGRALDGLFIKDIQYLYNSKHEMAKAIKDHDVATIDRYLDKYIDNTTDSLNEILRKAIKWHMVKLRQVKN